MIRREYNIAVRLWRSTKQDLWLRPILWIAGVLALAAAAYPAGALLDLPLPDVRPETAQSLLELLASAMLTVTTVAFSMVLVVITFASGQVSPRSIPGILRDAAIQDALGVFVAGLVFGLVGMLSIEAIRPLPNGPMVTVLMGAIICTLTVLYLVRLIHHVSRRVQVTHILAQQRHLADDAIQHFFALPLPGRQCSRSEADDGGPAAERQSVQLQASVSGYLQVLNLDDVYRLAVERDLQIRVRHTEGDYVGRDWPVFDVSGGAELDAETRDILLAAAQIGESRTPDGDPLFPLEVLGEIGERALSPGVNDTGTALAALDHLADCLFRWAGHGERESCLVDKDGRLRVTIAPPRLATALERTVSRILRSGDGNPEVERRVLWLLETLAARPEVDAAARREIGALRQRALQGGTRRPRPDPT